MPCSRAQHTTSATVRKYGSYFSWAINASSCSIIARTFGDSPSGKRRFTPASVSARNQLVGVWPAGTISSGYS
jgi:hypothetical protein